MDTKFAQGFIGVRLRLSADSKLFLAFVLAASSLAHAEVTAKDAWVRGTVPAQKITGAFMTLTSTEDAKIVGAASPAAKKTEIHASMMMGGVNHMHAIDAIALPAGKPVELKPGGNHVMLMDLTRQVLPGESVPIVFTIEGKDGKRTQVEVKAQVRPLGSR
ncbi:MAG: copper chaperone PCu(A)C [Pseudomonadota bacterium]|nr:copper chaperone PCu(A)C [Pseudomonadota bacterium]